MAPVFLGVDGGGTKTALCLVRADGEVLAQGQDRSVYYLTGTAAGVELVAEVLTPAVASLCTDAGISPDQISYAFFGLPGYGETSGDVPALDAAPRRALGHDRYRCDNDMVCGWAGSLGASDGINVISGTGSMAYGERGGVGVRVGGWGELFGDEGSAYWIAIRGLNAATKMSDGRLPPGPLLQGLRSRLDLRSDLDLLEVVLNRWGAARNAIAGLCPVVVETAELGDEAAVRVCDAAVGELVDLVGVTRQRLGFAEDETVPVSWSGGTFNASRIRDGFRAELLRRQPRTELRAPLLAPVFGAALYAARLSGHPLEPTALERLAREAETLRVQR